MGLFVVMFLFIVLVDRRMNVRFFEQLEDVFKRSFRLMDLKIVEMHLQIY